MDTLSVFWALAVLLIQCPLIVPITVSTNSPTVEVKEYSNAILSCEFQTVKEQNPRIEWKKKGTDISIVYFEGHFKGTFAGRASIDGATVTLFSVTREDAGEYRCEISAPQDTIQLGETDITLKVLVPPETPACVIPSSVLTGSVVQLLCRELESIPPATYIWHKDNKPLTPSRLPNATYHINPTTGLLMFNTVTKADSGLYSCQASNGVGMPSMCEPQLMKIDDLNVTGIVAAVVVIGLVITICGCGGYYAHRNGYFSRHRGRMNNSLPSQDPEDFRHTQSFML
ncbi:junctional adhesion molecule 2a isoform X2 [Esox lucius]|uniref:Ig-like domain-containing protein n=1 Tax=Esox lucius TaxID=8010 RepID=A0A3P8YX92_ESOLU|nr:junctional adhesion molecule 2a isoform X2 [Esox lucius]